MKIDEKKAIDKIRKGINRSQRWILFLGLMLSGFGLLRFLFIPARASYNLKTLQPTIVNGSTGIVIGLTLIIVWFLTNRSKAKIIQSKLDEVKNEQEKRKSDFKWDRRFN